MNRTERIYLKAGKAILESLCLQAEFLVSPDPLIELVCGDKAGAYLACMLYIPANKAVEIAFDEPL